MNVKINLKNSDKFVIVDDFVYEYIRENPFLKSIVFLENLREHKTSHIAVFQKWWPTPDKKGKVETIYLSRLIADKFVPKPTTEKKLRVNFINGNGLDCRIVNLEWCTFSVMSKKNYVENKYGFRGVSKDGKKFRASIYVEGKFINIGRYDTAEEAGNAYIEASKKIFGFVHKTKKAKNGFNIIPT